VFVEKIPFALGELYTRQIVCFQAVMLDLDANQFCPCRLVMFVQPVREDEADSVILGVVADRSEKAGFVLGFRVCSRALFWSSLRAGRWRDPLKTTTRRIGATQKQTALISAFLSDTTSLTFLAALRTRCDAGPEVLQPWVWCGRRSQPAEESAVATLDEESALVRPFFVNLVCRESAFLAATIAASTARVQAGLLKVCDVCGDAHGGGHSLPKTLSTTQHPRT